MSFSSFERSMIFSSFQNNGENFLNRMDPSTRIKVNGFDGYELIGRQVNAIRKDPPNPFFVFSCRTSSYIQLINSCQHPTKTQRTVKKLKHYKKGPQDEGQDGHPS